MLAILVPGEWWECTLHFIAMTAAPAGAQIATSEPTSKTPSSAHVLLLAWHGMPSLLMSLCCSLCDWALCLIAAHLGWHTNLGAGAGQPPLLRNAHGEGSPGHLCSPLCTKSFFVPLTYGVLTSASMHTHTFTLHVSPTQPTLIATLFNLLDVDAVPQAELHTWNVVIRHTRYRDLAKSIWGGSAALAQQLYLHRD